MNNALGLNRTELLARAAGRVTVKALAAIAGPRAVRTTAR